MKLYTRRVSRWKLSVLLATALLGAVFSWQGINAVTPAKAATKAALSTTDDWTTYGHDPQHTNYISDETTLTVGNVPNLKQKWSQFTANGIAAQPIEVNNVVYWGSWDGYFHAFTTAGQHIWDTQLGTTTHSGCNPVNAGINSTATYGTIGSTPVIFVGGGAATFYALNASTGAIIWSTVLGVQNEDFLWGSPTVLNGSIYIGVPSFGDCPLTRGRLIKMDTTTGSIQATFYVVPDGCVGGGIWGTPTLSATGMVYVSTGTYNNSCGKGEPYAAAMVKLRQSDLSYVSSWQLPSTANDVEFGSAPTLMDLANNTFMIGVGAKDGWYYAFNRSSIEAGPVWKVKLANNVTSCPQCGDGIISPSAYDGTNLYVAGGGTTINGVSCASSVNALNPLTGAIIWQHCLHDGPVLGPVTAILGVVFVTQGTWMNAMNSQTGATIFTFHDTNAGSLFYGPASVSRGQVFVGNMDGYLYNFGL